MSHDPLCGCVRAEECYPTADGRCVSCMCDWIAKVRADERERLRPALQVALTALNEAERKNQVDLHQRRARGLTTILEKSRVIARAQEDISNALGGDQR